MNLNIYMLAMSIFLLFSKSEELFSQSEERNISLYKGGTSASVLKSPKTFNKGARAAATNADCGTDTILYPYLKELTFSAPNDTFLVDAMVGNVRTASQAYHLSSPVIIKGIQFWGGAYSTSTKPQTLAVRACLYAVDAMNKPTVLLDSADVVITQEYAFYEAVFKNPKSHNTNFAVAVKCIPADTLAIMTNNSGAQWHTTPYHESLAWRRFGSGAWNSTASFFGQDLEYMIFPIVEYGSPTISFTSTEEQPCQGQQIYFESNAPSVFENKMFNLNKFNNHWLKKVDTTFKWKFGMGEDSASGRKVSHTFQSGGSYVITLNNELNGYFASCNIVAQDEIAVSAGIQLTQQPRDKEICHSGQAIIHVIAEGAQLSYQWQKQSENGFVDVMGPDFSGAQRDSLSILKADPQINNKFRVKINGSCSEEIISDTVSLGFMEPPAISGELKDVHVCPASEATFSVDVPGVKEEIQWQSLATNEFVALENGTQYEGVKSRTLYVSPGYDFNEKSFRVIVSNECGKDTSNTVKLIASDTEKPEFITTPVSTVITNPVYTYEVPTAQDNCGEAEVTLKTGLPSGATFPAGETVITYEAKDENNLTAEYTFTVTYESVTSMSGPTHQNSITLFPNPASEQINIIINAPIEEVFMEMMTADGKIIRNYNKVRLNEPIDISDVPKGIYILRIHHEDLMKIEKLIIK